MDEKVTVLAKVYSEHSSGRSPTSVLRVGSSGTSLTVAQPSRHALSGSTFESTATFSFDRCFDDRANNKEIFTNFSAKLLENSFNGLNTSVVVYGQPTSGHSSLLYSDNVEEGIIFSSLKLLLEKAKVSDNVYIGFAAYEISNDSMRDLISKYGAKRIRPVEDACGNVVIEGLQRVSVDSVSVAMELIRSLQCRQMNPSSVSAHLIVDIDVLITKLDASNRTSRRLGSKLAFFQIGGSGTSAIAPLTTREVASVQSSLMTLRSVVYALTPAANTKGIAARPSESGSVPYRHSLLTWVLRDALGGNSCTIFLALVSSSAGDADETYATLSFANRVAAVKNQAMQNELPCSISNRAVNKEIQMLWSKYEAESRMQAVESPKRKQNHRFSMEALSHLNQPPTNYEEELRIYKERALAAERATRERAELLWESYQQLQAQLTDTIQQVKEQAIEEAKRVIQQQDREQMEYLAEHASVLLIQVFWRKYQLRKLRRLLLAEKEARRLDRLRAQEEIQNLRESNASMKIQSLYHHRQRKLYSEAAESRKQALEVALKELNSRKTLDSARDQEAKQLKEQLSAGEKNAASRISELQSALAAKDREIQELRASKTAVQKTEAKQASEKDSLLSELKTAKLELRKAMEECERQGKLRAEADAKAKQALMNEERAKREIEAHLAQIKQLEEINSKAEEQTQNQVDEREKKVAELESQLESLRSAEAEARRQREKEIDDLREELKVTQANALEDIERLNQKLQERGKEESKNAENEIAILRTKIGTLELLLETNKAVTAKEVKEREQRLREIERLNKEIQNREREEIRRKNLDLEAMEICLKKLQKELEVTKESTSREVQERDRKLKELEHMLNEQLAQQRSVGASFMQYRRDSRQRESNRRVSTISMIPPAASTLLTATTLQQQHEDLLCVRVDVESFDERSALFYACSSSVIPEDPTTRTFNVKSPLYDLKKARWTRIRIKVIHGSLHRVDEVNRVCLEHHLPGGRATMHRLRVTKTELAREGGVQSVICDWDSSTSATAAFHEDGALQTDVGHQCFCYQKMEESGPMTLHATFVVGDKEVHWEYPLRFRNKVAVIEKIPGIGPKYLLSRRASDEVKHEYLNSSWFSLENESGNARAGPVCDGQRIILFSGYLQKHQSHRSGKVQRWFVFAPPFLLCYQDILHAAEDFSGARALPHSANRAMKISATTRVQVQPAKIPGVERVEFSVTGDEKTWLLQAANKEDLDRWTGALNSWINRERELHPFVHRLESTPRPALVDLDDDDEDDM